jgi:hypothetical protein
MVAQLSEGPCPMCEIPEGEPMGHSTVWPLDDSRHQHIWLELLDDNSIDALHTLGVYPIRKQFWQYPLCDVYRLWQPDELHQLLQCWVKDLLQWLLKYLKARQVKVQFDNQFTSVPWYPGLQHSSKWFDSLKCGNSQGNEIRGMIRTMEVNCAPILVCSKDYGNTAAETASEEMVIGAVLVLSDFSGLVS